MWQRRRQQAWKKGLLNNCYSMEVHIYKCIIQGALASPGCDVPVVEQAGGDDGKLASVTLRAVVP